MKVFRKPVSVLLAVLMLLSLIVVASTTVSAQTVSGKVGDCDYAYNDSTQELVIENGTTIEPDSDGNYPWESYRAAIKRVTIKGNVNTIGINAFKECTSLTFVDMPNSLDAIKTIKGKAFYKCTALRSIFLYNSVETIEKQAFDGCSALTGINLPKSLKTIGSMAFNKCTSLTAVAFPKKISWISTSAFNGCTKLADVNFPTGTNVNLGDQIFTNTALKSIYVPSSIGYIHSHAFGFSLASSVYTPVSGFTVYTTEGSAADEYAKANGLKVEYVKFLSDVKISNVVEPKVGASPVFTFSSTAGFTVANNKVSWYDETNFDSVKSTGKFKSGHSYSANFTLNVKDGYRFAVDSDEKTTVTAKVNSKTASVYLDASNSAEKTINVRYVFPTLDESSFETEPETEGEPPTEEIIPETEGEPPTEEVEPETEGEPATEEIEPETEGEPATEEIKPETEPEQEDITITNVYISGVVEPVAGSSPEYTASGSSGINIYNLEWFDVTDEGEIQIYTSDSFEEGKEYEVRVYAEAMSGYVFDTSGIAASINNLLAQTFIANNDRAVISVRFMIPETEKETDPPAEDVQKETITHIDITNISEPVESDTPQYTASASIGVYVGYLEWYDVTGGSYNQIIAPDTFAAGRDYEVQIYVDPEAGYIFNTAEMTVDINHKKATIISQDENWALVSMRFTVSEKHGEVNYTDSAEFFFLPSEAQEAAGNDYKLSVHYANGEDKLFDMTKTDKVVNGVSVYKAEIPFDTFADIPTINFLIYNGETPLNEVLSTPDIAAGSVITFEGFPISIPGESDTDKPTEPADTNPVSDAPGEGSTEKPTSAYISPSAATDPTEPIKPDEGATDPTEAATSADKTTEPTEKTPDVDPSKPGDAPTDPDKAPTTPVDSPTAPVDTPTTPSANPTEATATTKKKQPMKVKGKTVSVKAKKLKKDNVTIKKSFTVTKNKGKLSYKLIKNGTSKKLWKRLSISKKGTITITKGKLKKAAYKVIVQITAKGNATYKKGSKKATVKIKVK